MKQNFIFRDTIRVLSNKFFILLQAIQHQAIGTSVASRVHVHLFSGLSSPKLGMVASGKNGMLGSHTILLGPTANCDSLSPTSPLFSSPSAKVGKKGV
jgi:hypothetical protein